MSNLTSEELIKFLEEVQVKKEVKKKESYSVNKFIKEWEVTAGGDRVPNYVIFYTYRVKWKGQFNSHKEKIQVFFKTFSNYFKRGRTGKGKYYFLDGSKFNLTKEGKEEARAYEKAEKARRETIKKNKNKAP